MLKSFAIVLLFSLFSFAHGFAIEKEIFFDQLQKWQPPEDKNHPRLYFDLKEADNYFKQFQTNSPRILTFLSECDSISNRPLPDYSRFNESRYIARSESEKLAFAYVLTKNTTYANYAKGIIQQMIHWDNWVYEEHKPLQIDLGVAGVGYILALCYDWLYPVLSKSERRAIEQAILKKALLPFQKIYASKAERWANAHHNWRSVICGEMGVMALALAENVSDVKAILNHAMDGVVAVLSYGGIDGDWHEGVSYWGYGIGQATMFAEAMYHVSKGSVNLYDLPFLKKTANFGFYMRTPAGNCFNFSDCDIHPPCPWLMALFASHYQNPYWQWSAEKDLGHSIQDLLFFKANLLSKKPNNLELGKFFSGIQAATMRSSWENDAIFIGFKSGETAVNHSHLDLNSFIIEAYGKPLLIDVNDWPYAHYLGFFDVQNQRWDFESNHTIAHNTLLVDGQGQNYGDKFRGRIINFVSTENFQYVVGQADSAYGNLLNSFHRYIALIENQFMVIVDDVCATEPRKLEWLFHYCEEVEEATTGLFKISNAEVNLDLLFMRPTNANNRIVRFERHETRYQATRETTTQWNNFISISPLHRQKNYRFIVVAFPYRLNEVPAYSAEISSESEAECALEIRYEKTKYNLSINFAASVISIEKL